MEIIFELAKCFLPSSDAFMFMWMLGAVGITSSWIIVTKWFSVRERTDYDAAALFDKVNHLVLQQRIDDAYTLCASGGKRALPRIFASGLRKAKEDPYMITGAMEEEATYMAAALESKMNYLVMFSNVATLLGLLGTVFGLIMSFSAVSKPGVAAIEKSALLAAGISTAMNATLVGLTISVVTVGIYAFLRNKVDTSLNEIDRYSVALLNGIIPPEIKRPASKSMIRRSEEAEVADADLTPMLNLMIILIPVMLTSSEFVKIGTIELKLPESTAGAGGGGGSGEQEQQERKLDLGIVITSKGFSIFSYFKPESGANSDSSGLRADIPLVGGKYNFEGLNTRLRDIKKRALIEILRNYGSSASESTPISDLYSEYINKNISDSKTFPDVDNVKIVAEDKIKYQTVVEVMDAARGTKTPQGIVTMFPNVAIAGGIIQ